MFQLETVNELTLKATCMDGQGKLFTKAGAFISGQSLGRQATYDFEKVLLGPQGNPVQAILGQVMRRVTGENLPLMVVKPKGQSITYYANEGQHVTVLSLQQGQQLMVESENLLAFTDSCDYSMKFLAQGVISQKGLFTSVLKARTSGAQVAVLSQGNPIVVNSNDGLVRTDPDATVCWMGQDPGFKLDLSWKNLIGQASGESYQFEWANPGSVIVIQPNERKSGLDIGIDGHGAGNQPQTQQNQSLGDAFGNVGQAGQGLGNMLGGLFGGGR